MCNLSAPLPHVPYSGRPPRRRVGKPQNGQADRRDERRGNRRAADRAADRARGVYGAREPGGRVPPHGRTVAGKKDKR